MKIRRQKAEQIQAGFTTATVSRCPFEHMINFFLLFHLMVTHSTGAWEVLKEAIPGVASLACCISCSMQHVAVVSAHSLYTQASHFFNLCVKVKQNAG